MYQSASVTIRLVFLFFSFLIIPATVFSQKPTLKSISLINNWKLDIRGGFGTLLSEVPEKYLDRINNVNIPLNVPGPSGILSVRKGFSPHMEMGYQLEYLQINGDVAMEGRNYSVKTQALGNSFVLLYNLKRIDKYIPRTNYYAYYKIGAISLKNDPWEKMDDGSEKPVNQEGGNEFIKNVAVITGLGIGINYRLANRLSLVATAELNRSADAAADTYKIYKIFYHSENTVNNFTSMALGVSYYLTSPEKKKSTFSNSGNKMYQRYYQARLNRKKWKSSGSDTTTWYDRDRGK